VSEELIEQLENYHPLCGYTEEMLMKRAADRLRKLEAALLVTSSSDDGNIAFAFFDADGNMATAPADSEGVDHYRKIGYFEIPLIPSYLRGSPDNLITHRNTWLLAMHRLVELESEQPVVDLDREDAAFWNHELRAMEDMYSDLDNGCKDGHIRIEMKQYSKLLNMVKSINRITSIVQNCHATVEQADLLTSREQFLQTQLQAIQHHLNDIEIPDEFVDNLTKLKAEADRLLDQVHNGLQYNLERNEYVLVWTQQQLEAVKKASDELFKNISDINKLRK
jgi:hypothetical protein